MFLFPIACALHNFEEALTLPAWSQSTGFWHPPVGHDRFIFATVALTILSFSVTSIAVFRGKIGVRLLAIYSVGMAFNAVFPHLLSALVLGRYTPGVITAVLINLPLNIWIVRKLLCTELISRKTLIQDCSFGIPGLVLLTSGLLLLGKA